MTQKIVDTHIHVWNFDKAEYEWLKNDTSILKRTYNIEEIEAERIAVGITDGVLVQSSNTLEDTNWMLEVAGATPWIKGVVGWLPLLSPEKTNKLLNDVYLKNNYYKGVRHLIHDEPNADWLLQETVIESLKILAANKITFDVVGVLSNHIKTVLQVANKVPDLKMVFDHLNQPPISTKEKFGEWGVLIKEAATNKNFHAKISGLGTTTKNGTNWTANDIQPYVEFVLENFGEDRCFCGGDWPVSLLAGSYTQNWQTYKQLLTSILSEQHLEKVYYSNAANFYKL
ncbi:MAG: amidohydrolase family protein [Ferruginibacter sp.]|nr:amidohydrolase family protein [Ferruginibacter sp.]